MILTIKTTYQPATDLGYLLHKHPDRAQCFKLSFGWAHVFYPEASGEGCTVALLLDVDPLRLVRGPARQAGFALQPYVNDRPYVASSFLSVAIAQVFRSALNGHCVDRPHLVDREIPLEATITVLPCRGGEGFLRRLFEPLGYHVNAHRYQLDETFPSWGHSRYFAVTLSHTITLRALLNHLYVLVPVLDDDKHYWVGEDEIAKLLHRGELWLAHHPEKEQITRRYLRYRAHLTRSALAQLAEEDDQDPDATEHRHDEEEARSEQALGLHQQRLEAVRDALKSSGAARVLDLGCGEGRLLRLLLHEKQFTTILGLDVSVRSLELAARRLQLDRQPARIRDRIVLKQGSLIYRDGQLAGYDAAAIVEVIEHLDPHRLTAFERTVFEFARPATVVITTPNREYNVIWPDLAAGQLRHRDHRFEWTRDECRVWATRVAKDYGYQVSFAPVGPEDENLGAPSQMVVFKTGVAAKNGSEQVAALPG